MVSPSRRRNSRDRHRRRSRSRSPRKRYDEKRSRSRSRDRARRHRSRSPRYRSRSPRHRSFENHRSRDRDREREKSKDRKTLSSKHQSHYSVPVAKTDTNNITDLSQEERDMMKMMGFCNFDTTKGKKVDGNDVGAVHVILKRKYRQYMNRKGGFNRPLDFVA